LLTEGQKPLDQMRLFVTNNADQPADVLKPYPEAALAKKAAAPGTR
jgi:hypothetical protein